MELFLSCAIPHERHGCCLIQLQGIHAICRIPSEKVSCECFACKDGVFFNCWNVLKTRIEFFWVKSGHFEKINYGVTGTVWTLQVKFTHRLMYNMLVLAATCAHFFLRQYPTLQSHFTQNIENLQIFTLSEEVPIYAPHFHGPLSNLAGG